MPNRRHNPIALRLNLVLALVAGSLVLWSFLKEPSEPGSAIFYGFSFLRLALIVVVLSLLLTILIFLSASFRHSPLAQVLENFLVKLIQQRGIWWVVALWMATAYFLLFSSDHQLGVVAPYRERLLPILIWFAVLSVQFACVFVYLGGVNRVVLREYRGALVASLVVLILFGLLLLVILFTRIGLTRDAVYWQGPGVPILLSQVLLAAFTGILFHLFVERASLGKLSKIDNIVFLGLWAVAFLLWWSQPADRTWFTSEATAPNYQRYPFSDALVYDNTARGFLAGQPIPGDFWFKPLYAFFLTTLHVFAGGNYRVLELLQVFFLSVIPAIAYLLTARLGSRPAGFMIALLLILREYNALVLSNVIQVSHVKLFLSDVFAMGFTVVLLWLFFHWVEKPGERRVVPLVIGGVLGLLVLTRGHPIIMLPFVLCTVFFVSFLRSSLRWEAVLLTFLGFLLPLIPWVWRNYELTGKLALQYPASPYSGQLSNAYSFHPTVLDPSNLPPKYAGESDFEYYDRLGKQASQFALKYPFEVARFVSAHYFHNSIFSYIYLPYSFRIEDVRRYVKAEPFWGSWQGELPFQGRILLVIHLVMIALGFGYLWEKHKQLAFVPLLYGIGYNLSVSVGRLSGWRFILPADWITLIYFAVGVMQFYYLLRSFAGKEEKLVPEERKLQDVLLPVRWSSFVGFALFFFAIGIALTQGEKLFSRRYPVKSAQELKEEYYRITSRIPSSPVDSYLDDFLKTDNAVIAYGQALYPSFLLATDEEVDHSWSVYYFWPSYKPKPFSRVIFNLNGPRSAGVILPLKVPPSSFPDGEDVIVIGCLADSGEINALVVLIEGSSTIRYLSEPFPGMACPAHEPG